MATTAPQTDPEYSVSYRPITEIIGESVVYGKQSLLFVDSLERDGGLLRGIDRRGRQLVIPMDDRRTIWDVSEDRSVVGVRENVEEGR